MNSILWEILVPATLNGKEIPLAHHRKWDQLVIDITGGATILHTTKGQWKNHSENTIHEPMIPVRIACTEQNIKTIAIMTKALYQQTEVMYYTISDNVCFMKTPPIIDSFDGEYRFLSNFFPCSIIAPDGKEYPSVEHAYQAAKTYDTEQKENIRKAATPEQAKKLGKKATIRDDWDNVKNIIMETFVNTKFRSHMVLTIYLLATADAELIEGNWWGDTWWGVCKGVGENHLGKILMKVRDDIKNEHQIYITLNK